MRLRRETHRIQLRLPVTIGSGGKKCYLQKVHRQSVYHIRYGNVYSIDWVAVGGAFAEVKIVEFSLDYMREMKRYQIYQPVVTGMRPHLRQQTARSLIDMWTEVVHSWTSAHALELPRPPWRGESEEHIPVVVWLKKQQLPDTPRGGKKERHDTSRYTPGYEKKQREGRMTLAL